MTKTLEQRVKRIEKFLTEAQDEYDSPDKLLTLGNLHDTITNLVKYRFYIDVTTTSTLVDSEDEGYG
jgi:hypothetical protein